MACTWVILQITSLNQEPSLFRNITRTI